MKNELKDEPTESKPKLTYSYLIKCLNENIEKRLVTKLTQIFKQFGNENNAILNNIWCCNQIIIPLNSSNVKIRYEQPENETTAYKTTRKSRMAQPNYILNDLISDQQNTCPLNVEDTDSAEIGNFSLNIETNQELKDDDSLTVYKTNKTIQKNHIHTCFATNHLGEASIPLVIFPHNEFEANSTEAQRKSTCVENSTTGDLNQLSVFLKWLKAFNEDKIILNSIVRKESSKLPTVLLVNSFMYRFLFRARNPAIAHNATRKELIDYCKSNEIFIVFYPNESPHEALNHNVFNKFKQDWKNVLKDFTMKENPNTQKSFLYMFRQVLRIINSDRGTSDHHLLAQTFLELFKKYTIPLEKFSPENIAIIMKELTKSAVSSGLIPASNLFSVQLSYNSDSSEATSTAVNRKSKKIRGTDSSNEANGDSIANGKGRNQSESNEETNDESSVATNAQPIQYAKLTEKELTDTIDWINFMSKIGCLCMKYTYLRELSVKIKPTKSSARELIASDKRWLELINKNKSKITTKPIFNENEYILGWFDQDHWRMEYHNFIKEKNIENADSLWTFEIIQFPYSIQRNLLKAPEKDFGRPRNLTPKISVIFAFSASGDYIQPYFIYPNNFKTEASDAQTESSTSSDTSAQKTNEDFAQNGYVTCSVFEGWLSKCFLPYLKQSEANKSDKSKHVLLYCGKLAVVDVKNLRICQENRVDLFNLTHENQMPFNLLFQKSLRNRQIDLFLDSWRKVTTKQNLGQPIKCKSRQQFFNLFMDAFQNCIEEIGSSSQKNTVPPNSEPISPNQSFSTTSVLDFKNKMVSCFEQCQLWPINEQDYAQFIANAKAKLSKEKTKVILEEEAMETEDMNNISMKLVLKENNNVLNKEGEVDLNVKQTMSDSMKLRAWDSTNENPSESENLNSLKTQFHRSEATEGTENSSTLENNIADDTMNEELDSDFEEESQVNMDEDAFTHDSEELSPEKPKRKRGRKPGIKVNLTKSKPANSKPQLPQNVDKRKSKSSVKTGTMLSDIVNDKSNIEMAIEKVISGKVNNFVSAETIFGKMMNHDTEDCLSDLVNGLLAMLISDDEQKSDMASTDSDKIISTRISEKIQALSKISTTRKEFLELLIKEVNNDAKGFKKEETTGSDAEENYECTEAGLSEQEYLRNFSELLTNFCVKKFDLNLD